MINIKVSCNEYQKYLTVCTCSIESNPNNRFVSVRPDDKDLAVEQLEAVLAGHSMPALQCKKKQD
jgi:hypothetical protein